MLITSGTSKWASAACLLLLNSNSANAFSSRIGVRLDLMNAGTALFSSQYENSNQNDNNDYSSQYDSNYSDQTYNNDYSNQYFDGGSGSQERFKMVKQFNGDFKTVPIDEYYEQEIRKEDKKQRSVASEYGILRASRGANPNLTSPARKLVPKQWEWKRPSYEDRGKPRFRQIRTFSGDVKTIREDENPYLDGRIPKTDYGRVDGTGYVPDMGPESMSRMRYAPPPPRPDFRRPPGPPPRRGEYLRPPQNSYRPPSQNGYRPPPVPQNNYRPPPPFPPPPPPQPNRPRDVDDRSYDRRRMKEPRRRELDREYRSDDFRREMQKYKRDEYDPYDDRYGEEYYYDDGRDRSDPLKKLVKEAEKVFKSVTSVGGPYNSDRERRDRNRRERRREMEYLRRSAEDRRRDMPPYPPHQPPPPDIPYGTDDNVRYDYGRYQHSYDRPGNAPGSYASSAAVRSFETPSSSNRPPPNGNYYDDERRNGYSQEGPRRQQYDNRPRY